MGGRAGGIPAFPQCVLIAWWLCCGGPRKTQPGDVHAMPRAVAWALTAVLHLRYRAAPLFVLDTLARARTRARAHTHTHTHIHTHTQAHWKTHAHHDTYTNLTHVTSLTKTTQCVSPPPGPLPRTPTPSPGRARRGSRLLLSTGAWPPPSSSTWQRSRGTLRGGSGRLGCHATIHSHAAAALRHVSRFKVLSPYLAARVPIRPGWLRRGCVVGAGLLGAGTPHTFQRNPASSGHGPQRPARSRAVLQPITITL
jgi:hypothetical protein